MLVHDGGLVKTTRFKNPKYVGDPINAVKIFNEKESDELILLDIDATVKNTGPDYTLISRIAVECRMPLCYGGGIKSVENALEVVRLGVEKIAISSRAVYERSFVREVSDAVGSQSVTVVLDVKKEKDGSFSVYTHNGNQCSHLNPIDLIDEIQDNGAGEILINFIDNEGTMEGYDLQFAKTVRQKTSIPLTILGGSGSLDHVCELVNQCGLIGAAAGSMFVFKGKYRAVLITYPGLEAKVAASTVSATVE